ncbi:MAG TPA: Mut7-C RNAse domain-containing protein [Haliangiales bacterium]|nr:Mut7-C RNAse domain-containing protein [Haliangiales bacterium]
MSRIRKVYEGRFRALLRELNARRLEQGVQRLVARAQQWSERNRISPTRGLTQVHERLRQQVKLFANRLGLPQSGGSLKNHGPRGCRPFLCDAGLGGLARWLRAAGYETFWMADIDDAELVRQAQRIHATILTTDSLMMERGVLRDGIIPAFWLAPTLTVEEQLALVFREFQLDVRDPRCTSCGGELRRADKESVRERIPPRTARWLDEYFVCSRCGQLFWRGTHWRSISAQLQKLSDRRMSGVSDPLAFQNA